ncbi:DUF4245 domain-containing protein [Streptomyces tsukubensis]|uniref:DUF4245 domain-containing protein n=1 Tax=Streptomyces tsukubensis TaxID=83656 RepID=A0A1V4ADK1_9ACTN|nr:hypothetical protein B1H18_08440 [Streptomyces tsukubensis]
MRGKQTVRDMVLSLAVIVLVACGIYVFVPHDDTESPAKRVDYRVELLSAQRAASYPVEAPKGLSKKWKATSVRYRAENHDAWHLGFLDPEGRYVAIEQSTRKPSEFIDQVSQGAEKTNVSHRIAGATWQRYKGDTYNALVRRDKGATTVVTGSGTFEQMEAMARALSTEKPKSPDAGSDTGAGTGADTGEAGSEKA